MPETERPGDAFMWATIRLMWAVIAAGAAVAVVGKLVCSV